MITNFKINDEKKARISLMLSENVLTNMDNLYLNLQRKLPLEDRTKLTKSGLYEFILKDLFDEYIAKTDNSRIDVIITKWFKTLNS